MKRISEPIIFLVLILTVSCFLNSSKAEEKTPEPLEVGDMITDFTLRDDKSQDDVNFNRDIKGKSKVIAILCVRASCSACTAELDLMNDLAHKYGDGFKVYVINLDSFSLNPFSYFYTPQGYKVRYLFDPDHITLSRFGFAYAPGLVLADRDGKIIFKKEGYSPQPKDTDVIIKAVKGFLEK